MQPRRSRSTVIGSASRSCTTTVASPSSARGDAVLNLWESSDESWRERDDLRDRPVCSGAESFIAGTASCRIMVDEVDRALRRARAERRASSRVARRRRRDRLRIAQSSRRSTRTGTCSPSSTGCRMIKLGRISYVNMAPVFHRLEYEVDEVIGVPTELNRMLLDGQLDIAPISSIEYARHADRLRLLPRLCVSSEGAVDSIQLVTRMPLGRVRSVAVTPESATSVVLTKVLLPECRDPCRSARTADAKLLIGDAALKSAFEDPTPHYDLGRLWLERTGLPMVFAVWACAGARRRGLCRARARARRVRRGSRAPSPRSSHTRRASATATRAGFLARYFEKLRYRFGPRERAGLLHVPRDGPGRRRAAHVPELRFVATRGASVTVDVSRRAPTVADDSREGARAASGSPTTTPSRCCARAISSPSAGSRTSCATGSTDPDRGHVHHRPEHQLHERLRHGLRLLRLLPQPRRHARGLPAAEAGHLQEDRGDARDRRHRPADAGRPPSRTSASTTTRISSARSRRATRSTCTRSRRRRSSTSRGGRS